MFSALLCQGPFHTCDVPIGDERPALIECGNVMFSIVCLARPWLRTTPEALSLSKWSDWWQQALSPHAWCTYQAL